VPLLLTGDTSNIAFAVSRRGGDAILFLDGLLHNGELDDDGCLSVPCDGFLALLTLHPRISVNFRLGLGRGIGDMPAARRALNVLQKKNTGRMESMRD
jgi:hypothetical protein